MELDRRELKRQAREAMGLTKPRFWVVALIYVAMTTGVNLAVHLVTAMTTDPVSGFSQAGLFLSVFTILYQLVIDFGFLLWCLWAVRRLSPGPGALVQGFSVCGRVLWMNILIMVRVYILFFFVMMGILLVLRLLFPPLVYLFYSAPLLFVPAARILLWVMMLRYALAPYLLADRPDDGASAAVRRSVELMRGWCWELAKLELSFLGWAAVNFVLSLLVQLYFLQLGGFFQLMQASEWMSALSLLSTVSSSSMVYAVTALVTLPVTLWLAPYCGVALAGFYDARMKLQRESAPPL